MSHSANVLVAGLGSPHGDDQAGWLVAEQVLKNVSGTLEASEAQEENLMSESSRQLFPQVIVRRAMIPLDVLDWLEGVDVLHICDACESTSGYWKLHRSSFEAGRFVSPNAASDVALYSALNSLRCRGSHNFELPDVLRLAATTRLLPKRVIVWAIEGTCFQPEDVLSDMTRNTALQAADEILKELRLHHA